MLTCYRPHQRRFNQFFTPEYSQEFTPLADILEQDNEYLLKLDIPGIDKKDVQIEVEDGKLTVSGERKSTLKEDEQSCLKCERTFGKFSRTFKLNGHVEEEKITADFNNGELTLTLPKVAKAQKKQIEIN